MVVVLLILEVVLMVEVVLILEMVLMVEMLGTSLMWLAPGEAAPV